MGCLYNRLAEAEAAESSGRFRTRTGNAVSKPVRAGDLRSESDSKNFTNNARLGQPSGGQYLTNGGSSARVDCLRMGRSSSLRLPARAA